MELKNGIGGLFQRILPSADNGFFPAVVLVDPTTGKPIAADIASAVPLGTQSITVKATAATLAELLSEATATDLVAVPAATRTVWLQPAGDIRWAAGVAPNVADDASRIGDDIGEGQSWPISMSLADLAAVQLIAAADTIVSLRFEG